MLKMLIKHKKKYFFLKKIKLCPYGYTQVILSAPILKNAPQPNVFWLICPFLIKEISHLEEKGLIKSFEERLKEDEKFFKAYKKAHVEEQNLRKKIIELYFKNEFENLNLKEKKILLESGIGGIQNYYGVKCLHLHFSSFLGGIKNPIGLEIFLMLRKTYCENIKCKDLEKEI